MTLKRHHVHPISEIHNCYVLDFYLASGMWRMLKDLSQSIHEAADQTVNPFESLPLYLNPYHLHKIEMPAPRILQIENFSQNMLLSSTTMEEVHRLFNMAQASGVETVEWIVQAKECCEIPGRANGWNWNERSASNQFPLLEGHLLNPELNFNPTNSNTLILHPHYSNETRARASAIFPAPDHSFQPLPYSVTSDDSDCNLVNSIHNLDITE